MATYGNDINETIAMVTAGGEILSNNIGKVARGLRSVGANIVKLANEADSFNISVNGTSQTIELINKETGDMLNTYQVLDQIAKYWDDMTASEQSALALQLANKTQLETLSATVSNWDTAQKALNTSLDAEGSALEENNKILDSVQGKTKVLRSEFEELVLGKGGLEKLYKAVLDIGIAFLKFANSDIGRTIIQITLLTTTVLALSNAFKSLVGSKLATSITTFFKILGSEIQLVQSGLISLKTATSDMLSMMNPYTLAIMAVVAVVGLLYKGYEKLKNSTKEHTEALKEAQSNVESYNSKIDDLENKIKELNAQKLETTDETVLRNLEAQTAEYENQLEILKEQRRIEQERINEEAKDTFNSANIAKSYIGSSDSKNFAQGVTGNKVGSLESNFKYQIEQLEALNDAQDKNIQKRRELIQAGETESQAYADINKTIAEYNDRISEQRGYMAENANSMLEVSKAENEEGEKAKKLISQYTDLVDYSTRLTDVQSDTAQSISSESELFEKLGMSAEDINSLLENDEESLNAFNDALANQDYATAYAYGLRAIADSAVDLEEALNSTLDELSNIEDAYNSLTAVINDYNDNGVISLDNISKILTKYPQYIQYLQLENGQLTINKEGLDAIAKARLQDAEMLAYRAYMAREDEIAQADNNNKVVESVQVSQSFVNATNSEITALGNIIKALKRGEDSWDKYWTAESKGKYKYNRRENRIAHEENLKNLHTTLSLLESAGGATGSYTSAIDANTNAKNKNTSATKDNNKALEEQIKQYEKVIKYIKSKFDEEIDRIKELKDTEIDSIKERIDALESLRDAELDAIQVKIDALNEENDALSEQLELQQLLDNLAKAKSSKVKIYRDGRFVYDQDQEQVSEAQKALNEYYAKKRLQDQIKALEDYKDSVKKNYDKQIDDLKAFQKEREKYYDAQIKYWQDYKKNFENMVNSYENEQNRLLALQMTGIDFEAQGWQSRLGNLQSFVNSYIDLLRQQVNATRSAQAEIEAIQSQGSGGGSGWNGGSATVSSGTYYNLQTRGIKGSTSTAKINGKTVLKPAYQNGGAKMISVAKKIKKHASGSNYIKADELAVVGEDPHKEIVIGSNLNTNSGVMMNLQKGSGVVPATATSSLMALADKIRANGVNATANDLTSSGEVVNMDIANVNVKADNADEFVQSMREFKLSMLQRTYK